MFTYQLLNFIHENVQDEKLRRIVLILSAKNSKLITENFVKKINEGEMNKMQFQPSMQV